jgi:hypothetical protein
MYAEDVVKLQEFNAAAKTGVVATPEMPPEVPKVSVTTTL